jgi:membrane protein
MASPKAVLAGARAKAPWLDHVIRAWSRYQADTGDRLAAAVTFFGFLSFFPLLVLAASLLAIFLQEDAVDTVIREVNNYAPGLAEQLGLRTILEDNQVANLAGVFSALGLLYSGLGWVDALRESVRTVWHQNVQAGNIVVKKLKDVVVLAGLGATLVVSIGVSAAAGAFTDVALDLLRLAETFVAGATVTVLGTVLSLVTSTALFVYLFVRLPRIPTPWRKVLKGAVLAAVLFEVFKRLGAIYIERTTENPLFGSFAVVVGLLVWINLVSRMLLFCAAWTVTAPYDTDVLPSGTANPEQARKAGIPEEFADDDPDDPPNLLEEGAPSRLVAAVQGRRPPQDVPDGRAARRKSRRGGDGASSSGGDRARSPGVAAEPALARAGAGGTVVGSAGAAAVPGEAATRRVAQVGAAAISAGLVGVALYALRTVVGVLRR